jgi:hypothetical protein
MHGEQSRIHLSRFETLVVLITQAKVSHVELAQLACLAEVS